MPGQATLQIVALPNASPAQARTQPSPVAVRRHGCTDKDGKRARLNKDGKTVDGRQFLTWRFLSKRRGLRGLAGLLYCGAVSPSVWRTFSIFAFTSWASLLMFAFSVSLMLTSSAFSEEAGICL